jgi:hypothetical protein
MGAKKKPKKTRSRGARTSHLRMPRTWKDPAAVRMVALLDRAIAEGRWFKVVSDPQGGAITIEIGPRVPTVTEFLEHVRKTGGK